MTGAAQDGRIFVVGIDGASWNIADRLIESGLLPNLRRLKEGGAYGDLESVIPFITTPAWKCYSTGMDPRMLGVYHWFAFDKKTKKAGFNTGLDFQARDVWDWLGELGKKSVVMNMPQTYPPRPIRGVMVSGIPAMNWSEYTWPKGLKQRLTSEFGYKIIPERHYLDPKSIEEIAAMVGSKFAAAIWLLESESPDFLHLTIFNVDAVQHYHWKGWDDGSDGAIPEVWKAIDAGLGELLKRIDLSRDHLLLVSDHGSTRLVRSFHLNHWLEAKGYLRFAPGKRAPLSLSGVASRLGIPKETAAKVFMRTGAVSRILFPSEKAWKSALGQEMPDAHGEQGILGRIASVDWGATKCICIGEGLIYITDTEHRDSVADGLRAELASLADPVTGAPAARLFSFEELYGPEAGETSPDLVLVPEPGYLVTDHLNKSSELWSDGGNWSGFHRRAGLFLMSGPDVKRGEVKGTRIYDVAPTILALAGAEPPAAMKGRVLKELLPQAMVAGRRLSASGGPAISEGAYSKKDEESILESLKRLGYA
jgi:predicted AlkP superfamily phosphohydrolase/phosphomutase